MRYMQKGAFIYFRNPDRKHVYSARTGANQSRNTGSKETNPYTCVKSKEYRFQSEFTHFSFAENLPSLHTWSR